MNKQKIVKITKINRKETGEVELDGEIQAETLAVYREKALNNLKEYAELPGFRKGKAPTEVVANRVGERKILEEAIDMALQDGCEEIVDANNFKIIDQPKITVTKFVENGPLNFRMQITILPEIKLPNYKNIAKKEMSIKEEDIQVTADEIDESINYLRKMKKQSGNVKEEKLPELNDEFAKSLGVKDLNELKEKLKTNIYSDKKSREQAKKRTKIMEGIVMETKIFLPQILIENELESIRKQFEDELSHAGKNFNNYLAEAKKTAEGLKIEWKPIAEKRLKNQLILNEIAKTEKIIPSEEDISKEIEILIKRYPAINEERARDYIEATLTNELVLKFLYRNFNSSE